MTAAMDPLRFLRRHGIDEPCLQTNPVWCLDCVAKEHPSSLPAVWQAMASHGVQLPSSAYRTYSEQIDDECQALQPGVVGLLADKQRKTAFVTPLRARLAPEWHVMPSLPFTIATLGNLLSTVLRMVQVPQGDLCQGLFGYIIDDCLGRDSHGDSMTVAGLLSVLDACSGRREDVLRCACAVVEPTSQDRLRPVQSIRQKLRAFVREYDRGTLLVRTTDCRQGAEFDEYFDVVWQADTVAALAKRLDDAKLLNRFRQETPLDRHQLEVACERLRLRIQHEHRYHDALELVRHLDEHPVTQDAPPSMYQARSRTIGELYRHLGRYADAIDTAKREMARVRGQATASYDDQARSASDYAAALYDPHRFEEMVQILEPWQTRLVAAPPLVSPEVRMMVFNTLGRAQVALGCSGWRDNFRRSLRILEEIHPFDVPRTGNYLIHAELRNGRLKTAEKLILQTESRPAMNCFSRWMQRFLRAELSRRRGEVWSDPEMDAHPPTRGPAGHPFGLYFQATARQQGRKQEEAVERLRTARRFFLLDVVDGDEGNILLFLADCMRLTESSFSLDSQLWQEALASIQHYVRLPQARGLSNYYRTVLDSFRATPTRDSAELLLQTVPYF